jgi:hypothetical protein
MKRLRRADFVVSVRNRTLSFTTEHRKFGYPRPRTVVCHIRSMIYWDFVLRESL